MSRPLPLGPGVASVPTPDVADATSSPATEPVLSGIVQLYDPPMCCPTGLCGPGVDPALLQVARDLRWLAAHSVRVERYGLGQEPQAFVANPRIAGLLQAFGDAALPALVVNDQVVIHGRYPTRDELVAALAPAGANAAIDASCGAPGDGCC